MRLTLFNGSPRARRSNTKMVMDWFIEGVERRRDNIVDLAYLAQARHAEWHVQLFREAEVVIIAFPLYHDSMPSNVKAFIEALAPLCGREGNPPIGFFVQSGFPEARHSRPVERYLERLARRLGCPYLGTIIKGGVEGVQVKPRVMNLKLRRTLTALGARFGDRGALDPALVARLARPERFKGLTLLAMKALVRLGLANVYWDSQLKKNRALSRSFDRPFDPRP